MKKDVIIVGAGASGMMTAICCARNGLKVLLLEHKDQVGKKILATGNGKCNYTNRNMSENCFRGEDVMFMKQALFSFGAEDAITFFRSLGIEPKEKNGYVYPYSEQAAAVVDAMKMELLHLGVEIQKQHVSRIKALKDAFELCTDGETFSCEKIVLATGGKASSKLGSDGSGLVIARKLGHDIVPTVPALIGLCCKEEYYPQIAGIRMQGKVTLLVDGEKAAEDEGELQFTKYGISGIPVFQVSRYAAKGIEEGKQVEAVIDYMSAFSENDLIECLKERFQHTYKTAQEALIGLLPSKMIPVLLQQSGIKATMKAEKIKEPQMKQLAMQLKRKKTKITDTNGFEQAQVTAGGVSMKEVDVNTMESKIHPGLYFTGEILDIDGICGGYNLQWCWTSAYLASRAIIG